MKPVPPARRRIEHALLLVALNVAAAVPFALALWLEPDARGHSTHEQLGLAPCLPMKLWGVPCPGCGVTTSVTHFGRFEWWDALRSQPFGFALALAAVLAAPWAWIAHFRGRDLAAFAKSQARARWLVLVALLLLASWAYKLWIELAPRF